MTTAQTESVAGVAMPRLIYGTAWKRERTAGLVAAAVGAGFRGIDTACQPRHYDEVGVGAGLKRSLGDGIDREELYLQSKFSPPEAQDPARMPYDPALPPAAQVAASFAKSLQNLGTDYLDGLVLHSPLATPAATLEVWRALESIAESGGARLIGISNCYSLAELEALYAAARVKPSIVQNRFYARSGYDIEIRAFCREHAIVYQSFWTLTANPGLLAHPWVVEIAARHGRTPEQVLFRYLTEVGVTPLTGTTNVTHMRDDLAIFEFTLRDDELRAMTGLLA